MVPSFSALLLLEELARFSPGAIVEAMRAVGGAWIRSLNVQGGEGEQNFTIEVNGINLAVTGIPAPAPGFSTYRSDGPDLLWPSVEADLARHKAHISVIAGGAPEGREATIGVAGALTFVVAALLRLSQGIGVYWPAGKTSSPRKRSFMRRKALAGARGRR